MGQQPNNQAMMANQGQGINPQQQPQSALVAQLQRQLPNQQQNMMGGGQQMGGYPNQQPPPY